MNDTNHARPLRHFLPALAVLSLAALVVAGPATAAPKKAPGLVRVVYSIPDGPAVDIYLGGKLVAPHLRRGAVAPYVSLPSGKVSYAFRKAGSGKSSAPLLSGSTTVLARRAVTLVGSGFLRKANVMGRTYVKREPTSKPVDVTRVRVFPLSPDAPKFDVYLGSTKGKPLDAGRGYPMTNGYRKTAPAKKATFVLTRHGSKRALLKLRNRRLVLGQPYTLYVFGAFGPHSGEQHLTLRLVSDALPQTFQTR